DITDDQVYIFASEQIPGFLGRRGSIDQARRDQIAAQINDVPFDITLVAFQAFLQSIELRPICCQANSKDSDLCFHETFPQVNADTKSFKLVLGTENPPQIADAQLIQADCQ